jgi:hypothetical protein
VVDSLPANSRVGVEWLSKEDWAPIEQKWKENGREPSSGFYWEELIGKIESKGHQVVYLEEQDPWEKLVDRQKAMDDISKEKLNEDDSRPASEWYKTLIDHEERQFWASTSCIEVYQTERDAVIKKNTLGGNLELAIVGSGHSDLWVEEDSSLFEEYHREIPTDGDLFHFMQLIRNTSPDPNNLINTTNLQRIISLRETGRLVPDREPDFTGVYNPYEKASKNYFELFLDTPTSGIIIDTLGEAKVKGTFTEERVDFTKEYTVARQKAIKGEMRWTGCPIDPGELYKGEHFGMFRYHSGGSSFTMVNYVMRPKDLALSLANSMHDKKEHYNQFKR